MKGGGDGVGEFGRKEGDYRERGRESVVVDGQAEGERKDRAPIECVSEKKKSDEKKNEISTSTLAKQALIKKKKRREILLIPLRNTPHV